MLTGLADASARRSRCPSSSSRSAAGRSTAARTAVSRMRRDIPRFVRMMEDGVVDATPIISRRYPLERDQRRARGRGRRERPQRRDRSLGDRRAQLSPARRAVSLGRAHARRRGPAPSAARASSPTTRCSARAAGGTCASASAASRRCNRERGPPFGSYVPLGLEISRPQGSEAPCSASTSAARSRTSSRSATAASR